jgi:hypothetical protein
MLSDFPNTLNQEFNPEGIDEALDCLHVGSAVVVIVTFFLGMIYELYNKFDLTDMSHGHDSNQSQIIGNTNTISADVDTIID